MSPRAPSRYPTRCFLALRASGLAAGLGVLVLALALWSAGPGCGGPRGPAEYSLDNLYASRQVQGAHDPRARMCQDCHPAQFALWAGSQHARANRLLDPSVDDAAFTPERVVAHGSFTTRIQRVEDGSYRFTTTDGAGHSDRWSPQAVIAIEPLRQYLVPLPGGRLQAFELAYDPRSNDWFNVFGDEDRQPGEYGHWLGQGMNWNANCAYCHMTELKKGYDPKTDSYHTTWTAMGISCAQCHGDMERHARDFAKAPYPEVVKRSPEQAMHLCATCHTRREELTGDFKLGASFYDHYRPILLESRGVYHPDGQIQDEDFEFGSFIMSRKFHKGVTCLDCHEAHSGQLLLPAANDALCMSCHGLPTRNNATPIIPEQHTFHAPESSGSRCIECHMAATPYMVRDPRRDHGFTVPDPVLTKELAVPNSCNRCHADQSTDWAIEWSERWYGEKLSQRRSRERARVIARAWEGDSTVAADLVKLAATEEFPAWRHSLLLLLRPYVLQPEAVQLAVSSLEHEHPLVRSAGVRLLEDVPAAQELLRSRLADPVRLVRLDAAWALQDVMDRSSSVYGELLDWLNVSADQPSGALRLAEFNLRKGDVNAAVDWGRRAVEKDQRSAYLHSSYAQLLNRAGRNAEALAALERAEALEPQNADHPYLRALLLAEMQRTSDCRDALRRAVELAPEFGRAWYNLGLALAQLGDLPQAIEALRAAERLSPQSSDIPFARATIHQRAGEVEEAVAAAELSLRINPGYTPSRQLLQTLRTP